MKHTVQGVCSYFHVEGAHTLLSFLAEPLKQPTETLLSTGDHDVSENLREFQDWLRKENPWLVPTEDHVYESVEPLFLELHAVAMLCLPSGECMCLDATLCATLMSALYSSVSKEVVLNCQLMNNYCIEVVLRCLATNSDGFGPHELNDGGILATVIAAGFKEELVRFQAGVTMEISRLDAWYSSKDGSLEGPATYIDATVIPPSTIQDPIDNPSKPPKVRAKGTGRKPSGAWDHFDKIKAEDGVTRAVCKYYQKEYLADSKGHGTSNLLSHLTSCRKYPHRDVDNNGQQTLSFQSKKDGDEGINLVTMSFSVEAARRALAEMIVLDELPFRFVEGEGFKRFCAVLQPKFKNIPSCVTIAGDIVGIFNNQRDRLRKVLKGCRICLTTDMCTSIQNLNYMCLTAHFIDDDWKLQKRIINFGRVEDHKGETIGKKLEMCLLEWNIGSIFTLTVDNASSNCTTIKFLKRKTRDWKGTILGRGFFHMRCCAHILNVIVGNGLKELHTSIARVCEAVRYVRSSPNRYEVFKKCVEKQKIVSKSLVCLDVPTRWNSTYLMLEAAEKAFERLDDEDSNYRAYFKVCEGEDGDGQVFGDEDENMDEDENEDGDGENGRKKSRRSPTDDKLLSTMAQNMKEKFEKYWGNGEKINLLVYVAVLLDPRKQLRYLKFCFAQLLVERVVNEMTGRVKDCLSRLYEHYASHDSVTVEMFNVCEGSAMKVDDDCDDPHLLIASQFNTYLEEECSSLCKSEVDTYLANRCDASNEEKFDILGWWKVNSSKYRVLSQVACDVLAIPVSTVASESAFSTGGCILDPFRSSLSPMMVEALICTQNWLQSTIPISLRKAMDDVEELEQYDL
ncbi:unnamed protein product [Camellia sinensis]